MDFIGSIYQKIRECWRRVREEPDHFRSIRKTHSAGYILPLFVFVTEIILMPTRIIAGPRDPIHSMSPAKLLAYYRHRAIVIDNIVVFTLVVSVVLLIFAPVTPNWLVWTLAGFGILNVIASVLHYALTGVRENQAKHHLHNPYAVLSLPRIAILAFINFIQVSLWFACLYANHPKSFCYGGAESIDQLDSLYFSFVSILTIGYGDMYPKGAMRYLPLSETLVGILLITVLIGRTLGSMNRIAESNFIANERQVSSSKYKNADELYRTKTRRPKRF